MTWRAMGLVLVDIARQFIGCSFNSRNVVSKCVLMTWRGICFEMRFDDVAGNICLTLVQGVSENGLEGAAQTRVFQR